MDAVVTHPTCAPEFSMRFHTAMDLPRWWTKNMSLMVAVRRVNKGAEKRPPAVRAIASIGNVDEK
jgi:hypothetical protein